MLRRVRTAIGAVACVCGMALTLIGYWIMGETED